MFAALKVIVIALLLFAACPGWKGATMDLQTGEVAWSLDMGDGRDVYLMSLKLARPTLAPTPNLSGKHLSEVEP